MTKLQEIEQQIRKDIPRLMELTEGCKFHSGYGVETIVCIKGDKEDVFIFKDLFSNVYETNGIPQHYKIIGHEIMLNDVLEWMRNCKNKIEFDYKTGYFLDEIDYYYSFSSNHYENASIENKIWNLSSPYLKDQSEELIDFLYELKNK